MMTAFQLLGSGGRQTFIAATRNSYGAYAAICLRAQQKWKSFCSLALWTDSNLKALMVEVVRGEKPTSNFHEEGSNAMVETIRSGSWRDDLH